MTAPTCGARTWVTPDEVVTCDQPAGHDANHERIGMYLDPGGVCAVGAHTWREPKCCIKIGGVWNVWTIDEARAVRDRIQVQLDALDPDAAIAEAERRMLDAFDRRVRLLRMADVYSDSPLDPIEAAAEEAKAAQRAAYDAWLALVEVRGAKGGGA